MFQKICILWVRTSFFFPRSPVNDEPKRGGYWCIRLYLMDAFLRHEVRRAGTTRSTMRRNQLGRENE